MSVLMLIPTQILHKLNSGRTEPFLIEAVDDLGAVYEVVLKLRGREYGQAQQTCELMGGQFARWLGIVTPRVAVVKISADFVNIVPVEYRQAFAGSIGDNYGSLFIGPGASVWPLGMQIKSSERNTATAIFAFDVLVQNPDRRADNPNLLFHDGTFHAIDHEHAFSHLVVPVFGQSHGPWSVDFLRSGSGFAANHVFFHQLKQRSFGLAKFAQRLQTLSTDNTAEMVKSVPHSWIGESDLPLRIANYLHEASRHAGDFTNNVEYILK